MDKDQKTLTELYSYICKDMNIRKLPLKFKKVGKGGACCTFEVRRQYGQTIKTPIAIEMDLGRICIGSAWALCHEIAHQIEISYRNNSTHDRNFKALEADLIKKYTNCPIARKLIF